jgi:hypothetical protein
MVMEQRTVDLLGQRHIVQVFQLFNNVWVADGKFCGERLRTRGSTAGKAVSAWRKAAVGKPRLNANSSKG